MEELFIKKDDVVPILQKLINFKTVNPPGHTIEAINYITTLLREVGIEVKIQNYEDNKANIIARYGQPKNNLILTGHIDVVPEGNQSKWVHPPFSAKEEEGKIYGRGATDMKGAIACFVAILKKLKEKNITLTHTIKLLVTSDEEVGMGGAKASMKQNVMDNTDFVVIGEPTELSLATAEKGVYWVQVKVNGKSAHGSKPHLGINAIEGAVKLITEIKKVVPKEKHELLDYSTLNIGKIDGGTAPNVVPEYCEFTCDFRLVPGVQPKKLKKEIEVIIDDFNRKEKAKAEIVLLHDTPALELNEEHRFYTNLKQKIKEKDELKIIGVPYGTDGAILIPKYNTPFIIFGPGRLDKLHVTDEYVEVDELIEYSNILIDTIIETYRME